MVLRGLLALFPVAHPVEWISKSSSVFTQNHVCDRIMVRLLSLSHAQVLIRDWQEQGGGSFFPSLPTVDYLRSALYVYAHHQPFHRAPTSLNTLLLSRRQVRCITNLDAISSAVEEALSPALTMQTLSVDAHTTDELLQVFAVTDIVVSVYGSEILYALFMEPNSAVVEVYPPFWDWSHYKRFAVNVGLIHKAYKAKGERGPQCRKKPNSNDCLYRGTRDRNVTLDASEMVALLKETTVDVFRQKYGRFWSFD